MINRESAGPPEHAPRAVGSAATENETYGQILKSSALIGGSSVLNVAIGIIRTKAMAVLLGPAGVGLLGVYGSIVDLTRSMAEMGINNSGVRQIAEAVGSGDTKRIARTVTVLRRMSILLGIFGAVLLLVFSSQVSTVTFGTDRHVGAVALLSFAVFFRLIADGQGALIQGMRRISDLAKMGVLGALFGTIISIPLVYFLREDGVVPSLVAVAVMTVINSWWYARKVQIQPPSMTASEVRKEATALLKLGFAFMSSGLMMTASAYAVRLFLSREAGVEAAGLYQSAWTLGGLYVGIILGAMFADYYPRLTGVATNTTVTNRMVNEQARASVLLAGPGIIATLTFAPLVISLFYTANFDGAAGILRWICLGTTLQVIIAPVGYVILARNAQQLFFWTELAWTVVHLGLAWLCVRSFGADGAGMAFFGAYAFHGLLIYSTVRRINGFRWSTENKRTGLLFLALVAAVFCSFYILPPLMATGVGTLATILSAVYSLRILLKLIPLERIRRMRADPCS